MTKAADAHVGGVSQLGNGSMVRFDLDEVHV